MSRYRKKPTVIDAVQYAGAGNMNPRGGLPDWLWDALEKGTAYFVNGTDPLFLRTANGPVPVGAGDYICRQVINGKDDLWPVKSDIFAATYDPEPTPYE